MFLVLIVFLPGGLMEGVRRLRIRFFGESSASSATARGGNAGPKTIPGQA
jgi:hypothetical protein